MSRLRQRVAERLVQSQSAAAILTTFNEVNMAPVMEMRKRFQEKFEKEHGVKLTFMPFFVRATIIALQQYPIVNASLDGDNIRYHKHVNAGIAVALDWGLIVPVLKNADELNFLGLQRGITDLGELRRGVVPDRAVRGEELAGLFRGGGVV